MTESCAPCVLEKSPQPIRRPQYSTNPEQGLIQNHLQNGFENCKLKISNSKFQISFGRILFGEFFFPQHAFHRREHGAAIPAGPDPERPAGHAGRLPDLRLIMPAGDTAAPEIVHVKASRRTAPPRPQTPGKPYAPTRFCFPPSSTARA